MKGENANPLHNNQFRGDISGDCMGEDRSEKKEGEKMIPALLMVFSLLFIWIITGTGK